MSGGVGPTGDGICLPSEEVDRKLLHDPTAAKSTQRRFLSLRQLNSLAVVTVLSASGMVAAEDLAFSALSLAYIYFLSSAAFPPSTASDRVAPVFGDRNPLIAGWVAAGALVGLVLPVAYILDGMLQGDKEGIKAAAPHVFLLACQVFIEGVTSTRRFSLPMRAFVPVFYNAKRMFTIADWVRGEIGKAEEGAESGSPRRVIVGRGLAVANLVFWGVNLLGFLLPVYLPRALKRYYAPAPLSSSSKAKL